MERGLLRGVAVLRLVAFIVLVAVVAGQHARATHPLAVWLLLGLAGAVTVALTTLAVIQPSRLVAASVVGSELCVGATLLLADGVVFAHGHVGSAQGGLAGSWPIAGILSAGIAFGPWVGLTAGATLGVAHSLSVPLNGENITNLDAAHRLALFSSLVLNALYGCAAGYATRFVRRYDDVVSTVRAREEVARTLHDGVLQTLAIVARRTNDPELATMARDQDRELRNFIATSTQQIAARSTTGRRDANWITTALRATVDRYFDASTSVVISVASDLAPLRSERADALVGAANEALANVSKHAEAQRVTVYVEPQGRGVFCSVKDDGRGFDLTTTSQGSGPEFSIRRRIADAGGRCEIVSALGQGTEVKLWL